MSEWLDGFSMAWGMFLAIPCPLRRWNEKAREKMLVCLPLVGLAVGGIWLGLYLLLRHAAIGGLYAFLMAALPWLVTGFMHLDGYMDVCDAVVLPGGYFARLGRAHYEYESYVLLRFVFPRNRAVRQYAVARADACVPAVRRGCPDCWPACVQEAGKEIHPLRVRRLACQKS